MGEQPVGAVGEAVEVQRAGDGEVDGDGQGGADRQWQTLTIYLYNLGWNQKNFGRASAVAWLLFLIIVLISLVNFFVIRRISSKEDAR